MEGEFGKHPDLPFSGILPRFYLGGRLSEEGLAPTVYDNLRVWGVLPHLAAARSKRGLPPFIV